MIRISPRSKEYLTVGRTLEELRSYESQLRAAGFRKRRGACGRAKTTVGEFFQWWDRIPKATANNICVKCKEPRARKKNGSFSWYCLKHLVELRERQRVRLGFRRRYTGASSYCHGVQVQG